MRHNSQANATTKAQAPDEPRTITQTPTDYGAPLTLEEEEAYSLLVTVARANDDGRKAAPKTRVEFEQLATRARGVRFLLDYFSGVSPSKCLKSSGLTWGDLSICRLASPDFDAVYKFCFRQTGERLTAKALDAIERALDGVDIGSAAASSARFLLERLQRDTYGDPRYKYLQAQRAGGDDGPRVAYQINIINTATAPAAIPEAVEIAKTSSPWGASLCGQCVDGHADGVKTPEKITA